LGRPTLDRSAVGQLSSLSGRTKWQRLPAGDTLRSVSAAGSRFHFVLSEKDEDEACSFITRPRLHWLDVPERVMYKLSVMVFNCLHGQALPYLVELYQPVAGVTSRQHLRSATQQLLVIPRHQLSSYGRRAFCVAGPSDWNSVPDSLRDPIIGRNSFRQSLKTFLPATYTDAPSALSFTTMRYRKSTFYLHTFLLSYTKQHEMI